MVLPALANSGIEEKREPAERAPRALGDGQWHV